MIRRYDFNAPAHHQFVVGGEVHPGGTTGIELEESLAVDDRLSLSEDQSGLESSNVQTDEPFGDGTRETPVVGVADAGDASRSSSAVRGDKR